MHCGNGCQPLARRGRYGKACGNQAAEGAACSGYSCQPGMPRYDDLRAIRRQDMILRPADGHDRAQPVCQHLPQRHGLRDRGRCLHPARGGGSACQRHDLASIATNDSRPARRHAPNDIIIFRNTRPHGDGVEHPGHF